MRHAVGQCAQPVVCQLEALEVRELGDGLGQRGQRIAKRVQLPQRAQRADRLGELAQLVASEPQALELCELADPPWQAREAVALETQRGERAHAADLRR